MIRRTMLVWCATFVMLIVCAGSALATDISGPITTTLTILDDSKLVGDVTCTVSGAPCIMIDAVGITLDLNGYSMTGLGDPLTGCGGNSTANEHGILVNARNGVTIHGPGVVQQFRNQGIVVANSTGVSVTGVTASTNCASGIWVGGGGGDNQIIGNVSVRNGNSGAPCGGI
jgi:hypothetical protein